MPGQVQPPSAFAPTQQGGGMHGLQHQQATAAMSFSDAPKRAVAPMSGGQTHARVDGQSFALTQKMQDLWVRGSSLWDTAKTMELRPANSADKPPDLRPANNADKTLGVRPVNIGRSQGIAPPVYSRDRAQPVYCAAHLNPTRRGLACKVECQVCRGSIRTNFAQCKLCPYCSERERRCVICGDPEHEDAPIAHERKCKVALLPLGARRVQQIQPEAVDSSPSRVFHDADRFNGFNLSQQIESRAFHDAEYDQSCDREEREQEPEHVPMGAFLGAELWFSDRLTRPRQPQLTRWPDKLQL